MLILNLGLHDAMFKNIEVDADLKRAAFIISVSDAYKNFPNLYGFYVEDTKKSLEVVASIENQDWVVDLLNEGEKVYKVISSNSENMFPLSDILENKELLSKAKGIYI